MTNNISVAKNLWPGEWQVREEEWHEFSFCTYTLSVGDDTLRISGPNNQPSTMLVELDRDGGLSSSSAPSLRKAVIELARMSAHSVGSEIDANTKLGELRRESRRLTGERAKLVMAELKGDPYDDQRLDEIESRLDEIDSVLYAPSIKRLLEQEESQHNLAMDIITHAYNINRSIRAITDE